MAGRLRDLAAAHTPAATATSLALGAAVVSGVLLWPGHQSRGHPTNASRDQVVESVASRAPHHVRAARLHARPHPSAGHQVAGASHPTHGGADHPAGLSSGSSAPTPPATPSQAPPTREPQQGPPGGSDPGHAGGPADAPDVDVRVRLVGLPPGGSTSVGVSAENGLLDRHPVRRRIVVGATG